MSTPEIIPGNHETKTESLEHAAKARMEELQRHEQLPRTERNPADAQEALQNARREALAAREVLPNHHEKKENAERQITDTPTQRREAYQKTMQSIQQQMPPAQRTFSRFIHSPKIEQASEVIGSTVVRPNSILLGALCAFLAVLGLYALAKRMGFALSGFETIGAFIIGWAIGLVVDGLRGLFRKD